MRPSPTPADLETIAFESSRPIPFAAHAFLMTNTKFAIERRRRIVLSVHDKTGGCRLLTQGKAAVKGISQQFSPDPLPAKFGAHGEPTEKDRRNHGPGLLLRNRARNIASLRDHFFFVVTGLRGTMRKLCPGSEY